MSKMVSIEASDMRLLPVCILFC